MQVTLNGEVEEITENELTILRLLEIKNVESPHMVSVNLNGKIIDRDDYETTIINDNDTMDFLYFMGGGSLK